MKNYCIIFIAPLLLMLITFSDGFAESIGNYSEYWQSGDTLFIRCDTAVVSYMCVDYNILRTSFFPDGNISFPSSYTIESFAWQLLPFTVVDQPEFLLITAGDFTITAQKNPYRTDIAYLGNALLNQPDDGGLGWNGIYRSVEYEAEASDHFYGAGERSIPFDRKGYYFSNFNQFSGAYELGKANMNINIPLVVNPRGYGVFFDMTYTGSFDLAYAEYDRWSFLSRGGLFIEYLIAGDMLEVLDSYSYLTGHAPMPPKWCLGYIQSRYGYETQAETEGICDSLRLLDFPCDAICLDLYWYVVMGDMTWDLSAWPNPSGMLSSLLDQGIKTILIEQPYVWEASLNYNTALTSGYFGADSNGVPIILPNFWEQTNAGLLDITNPVVKEWWWNFHEPLIDQGVAGWWTDLHEPEVHPDTMEHYAGSMEEVHNIFALEWAKNLYEHYRSEYPDKRVYNQTRSGYAGMQRYSVMPWSNDTNGTYGGLAAQLPIMLGMSMSGVGINHADIGGFFGLLNGELYTRWMQFGCFTPVVRTHGWRDLTAPWQYGEPYETICRKYLKWRYRLMPYIYSLAWEFHEKGTPIARPLILHYPADAVLVNFDAEYMFGPNILAAPVVQGGVTQKFVYLPQGQWIDFWSEEKYYGPGWRYIDAALENMPLLVKGGSILPLQTERDWSDQTGQDTLIVRVYSEEPSTLTLYEDDGESWDYESGFYALTELDIAPSTNEVDLTISAAEGSFTGFPAIRTFFCDFRVVPDPPQYVHLNGAVLTQQPDSLSLVNSGNGWCYQANQHSVLVKYAANVCSSAVVTVQKPLAGISNGNNRAAVVKFQFDAPFPNPFNNTVKLQFSLPAAGMTSLVIFDIEGREVCRLVEEWKTAGDHQIAFDAQKLASGIYFARLQSGNEVSTQKLVLLK